MSDINLTPTPSMKYPQITTFFMNIHLLQFITIPNYQFQVNFWPPIYYNPLQLETGEYLFWIHRYDLCYGKLFNGTFKAFKRSYIKV